MSSNCVEKKTCGQCHNEKDTSEFNKARNNKDGFQWLCRVCEKLRHLTYIRKPERRKLKQEYDKEYYRKRNYGISFKEYELMVANQDSVCAICKKPCSRHKVLSIDHNHDTGSIRGLLCHRCNNGLGLFNEDINILESAIEYLRREIKSR